MTKKNIIFSLISLTLFFNYSCQEKSNEIILSGTIKNGPQTIELRPEYDIAVKSKRKIIHLDENGTFLDTINIEKKELYLIWDKTNMIQFYLTPSSKYSIEYDSKKFKSEGVTLKGDDIAINEYYINKINNRNFNDANLYEKSEKKFRSSLNDIKDKQLQRLNASKLPNELKTHERASIKYEYLSTLNLYIGLNNIDIPSDESKKELNIDYLNEEEYKTQTHYKYLVSSYFRALVEQNSEEQKKQIPSYSLHQNAIKELASIITNNYIKNDIIAYGAKFYFEGSKDFKACYNDFIKYYTGNNKIIKAEMLDLYNHIAKLQKGMPSPKFTGYKNYDGGMNSLDDFKGKFVFIDIWATWCGSCYNEMPALKKLEKKYNDIVFLSIAWKDDEDKWRNTIKRESLTGVQLFATKKDNSFFEEYGVTGIPRYILIDPKGNIIDYSAPRPSDEKLEDLFKNIDIE